MTVTTVDEDGSLTITGIAIDDLDNLGSALGNSNNIEVEVTVTVQHGTLTLPAASKPQAVGIVSINATNALGIPNPPPDGTGGSRHEDYLVDGSGLTGDSNPRTDYLVHSAIGLNDFTKWSVSGNKAGLMIELNDEWTIDVLQLWNFNAQSYVSYGTNRFELYVSSSLTRPAGAINDAADGRHGSDPLAAGPSGVADYLGQTYLLAVRPPPLPGRLGDQDGSHPAQPIAVTGRWLLLVAEDTDGTGHVGLSEIGLYGRRPVRPASPSWTRMATTPS